MIKLSIGNGYYKNKNDINVVKLDELLKEKNISINKLIKDTNTDFKVLKRMLTGELVRFDIFVLARLCDYFNCKITDIIEYVPNKN